MPAKQMTNTTFEDPSKGAAASAAPQTNTAPAPRKKLGTFMVKERTPSPKEKIVPKQSMSQAAPMLAKKSTSTVIEDPEKPDASTAPKTNAAPAARKKLTAFVAKERTPSPKQKPVNKAPIASSMAANQQKNTEPV